MSALKKGIRGWAQVDLLGQVEVAREDVSGQALALLLEKVADPLIDLFELADISPIRLPYSGIHHEQ